jgi:DNA-binding CsgD family transcriptional regulator
VHELVGRGPALLVVEDLHALDPASLSLIAELACDPTLPAMLLVTSLPARHGLVARTLARLCGSAGVVRQHLGPLGPAEVAEIAPPGLAGELLKRSKGNPYHLSELLAALPSALTAREQEVLSFLAAGMSNKQMARSMGISIRTVAVHVSNVLRKTGNTSRTAAAVWAAARFTGSRADTPG